MLQFGNHWYSLKNSTRRDIKERYYCEQRSVIFSGARYLKNQKLVFCCRNGLYFIDFDLFPDIDLMVFFPPIKTSLDHSNNCKTFSNRHNENGIKKSLSFNLI